MKRTHNLINRSRDCRIISRSAVIVTEIFIWKIPALLNCSNFIAAVGIINHYIFKALIFWEKLKVLLDLKTNALLHWTKCLRNQHSDEIKGSNIRSCWCSCINNVWCGVAQLVSHRLAVRQARVRFSARHRREVFPTELTSDDNMERGLGECRRINVLNECD